MREHEEWGSRMRRGRFFPDEWATAVKRDIALVQSAQAALRREIDENEGDDPMSDEYKSLDTKFMHARSDVGRHLNYDVLLAIADLVLEKDHASRDGYARGVKDSIAIVQDYPTYAVVQTKRLNELLVKNAEV